MLALTAAVITGVICIVVARRAMEIHLIGADGYVMDYHICQFMNVIAMIASVFTVYFGGIPLAEYALPSSMEQETPEHSIPGKK